VSKNLTAENASRTIWHELTHAAQTEADPLRFHTRYREESARVGYRQNRFEIEARENEAFHDVYALTR
jgi:hypothetical protein